MRPPPHFSLVWYYNLFWVSNLFTCFPGTFECLTIWILRGSTGQWARLHYLTPWLFGIPKLGLATRLLPWTSRLYQNIFTRLFPLPIPSFITWITTLWRSNFMKEQRLFNSTDHLIHNSFTQVYPREKISHHPRILRFLYINTLILLSLNPSPPSPASTKLTISIFHWEKDQPRNGLLKLSKTQLVFFSFFYSLRFKFSRTST